MNGPECQQCNVKCSHCELTNKDQCLICKEGGIGRINTLENNCGCQDGYYEDLNTLNCLKCAGYNCKTCNSDLQCVECLNSNVSPPDCEQT